MARVRAYGHCPRCGYDLRDRTLPTTCPECGASFDEGAVLLARRAPSAIALLVRFSWPYLAVVALVLAHNATTSDPYALVLDMMIISAGFLVSVVNGIINGLWLVRSRFDDRLRRRLTFHRRLKVIGRLALIMFYVTVIVPPVIFGGCTWLIMYG